MSSRSIPERFNREDYASTKRFYDLNAESYAASTRSLSMEPQIEAFIKRLQSGSRIIDLGCGSGRDLSTFSSSGFRAIGLDFSFKLARLAEIHSNCPVVVGDLCNLPFAAESFDGVWASASLLHLKHSDVRIAISEAQRITTANGYFFSSIKCGEGEEMDPKGRLFSYFQPSEWLSKITEAGFDIVDSRTSLQVPETLEKNKSVTWFSCTAKKIR